MKKTKLLSLMLVSIFFTVSLSFPAFAGDKPKKYETKIYRDNYGVPHVYAKDTYGLFYGYGYAIATDRLFQMEMSRRTVLGTVSEVLAGFYLNYDIGIRSNYAPASIQKQYQALDQKY